MGLNGEKMLQSLKHLSQVDKMKQVEPMSYALFPGYHCPLMGAMLTIRAIKDIYSKLPEGVDTVVGAKGIYLSGGEQQRIAIARVMLKNTPILILDEATAFADPDNEAKVQAAFRMLAKGKTVLMIAHRLSTVTGMDRIVVIKDGKIADSGTHEQLKEKDGLYAEMWKQYNKAAKWKVGVVND